MKTYRTWFIIVCYMVAIEATTASRTNFQVKRFEICNGTQHPIKITGNVTKTNGNQYLTFEIITPVAWDDNLSAIIPIHVKTTGKTFTELFVIREKNICKAANTFLGEFWYDIERAAQVIPGTCPIPAGKYRVHRMLLDFRKISLQTFPFGILRFMFHAVDRRNNNAVLGCLLVEVENILE